MSQKIYTYVLLIFAIQYATANDKDDNINNIKQTVDKIIKDKENFFNGIDKFVGDRIKQSIEGFITTADEVKQKWDDINKAKDKFLADALKQFLCFPGFCDMYEKDNVECVQVEWCSEGSKRIESWCGCCSKCIPENNITDFPATLSNDTDTKTIVQ